MSGALETTIRCKDLKKKKKLISILATAIIREVIDFGFVA